MVSLKARTSRRQLRAFLFVPFIAAGVWYVLMLLTLLVVNGRLRLMTDVFAMGLGAVLIGLPVASIITVVLAIPGYYAVRATVGVSAASAVIGGALLGLIASIPMWLMAGEWTFISPLRAVIIGAVSSTAWWRLGGGST